MRPSRWYLIRAWLFLAALTLIAHGWSLDDGLFVDDHLHQQRLARMGWSWSELLAATTVDPQEFIETWWQERVTRWQYARPFSVLLMKTVHELSGGSAEAHHAVSLILHWATACLVLRLCFLLTGHRLWSLVGGSLFVVYSHAVITVGWLAAQNTILQTLLMLAALLCYIRASGLSVGPAAPESPRFSVPPAVPGLSPAALVGCTTVLAGGGMGKRRGNGAGQEAGLNSRRLPVGQARRARASVAAEAVAGPNDQSRDACPCHPTRLKPVALGMTLVFWGLALFSRENAVLLPVVLVAFDWAFGGRRHAWARRRLYMLLAVAGMAFVVWRLVFVHHPMPDVYVRHPDGPGYWLWCLAKLMHYLTALVWQSPMTVGPSGRINPFSETPGDCLLMFGILAAMGGGYMLACRRARGFWIWPMWLVLSVLPVLPVLATPHSGYLGGVGFAVAMVLGPGLGRHIRPVGIGRWSPAVAIGFFVATCTYLPIYRTLWNGMVAAERCTVVAITEDEPPSDGVTDLFFVNLPFVNIYAKLCLGEAWGAAMDDVRCNVLTYAPGLVRMEQPCRLEQINGHSFAVEIEEKPYFSGLLGRFLIEAQRKTGRFETGQVVAAEQFDARIDEADADGVWRIVFTFREPLASEHYRFYLTTRECPAARVRFLDAEQLAAQRPRKIGAAGEEVECPLLPAAMERRREGLFRVRRVAGKIIRSDLYLTGAPFPGPR